LGIKEVAMLARWVSPTISPKPPVVDSTVVAHWWPWKYYFVSTIYLNPSHPLALLTRSLETGQSYKNGTPGPDKFVTQIFTCDKYGWVKSMDYALYEREYSNLAQAKSGHKKTVDLLAQGRLKLKRISHKL
jgi:hypothetical protein